ncbi:MAG: type 4a pilus biogenesis protein PilO [Thermodesulfobacteriota bacterium]
MNPKLDALKKGFDAFVDTKVSRLTPQHKLLICIGAWALPVVACTFLVFMPKNTEIGQLNEKKGQLEQELQKVEKIAREIDKHRAEMQAVEEQFKAAALMLPEQKEIPNLLTNISGQGTNSGLEFLSFQPKSEVPKEFYAEIPVDIAVAGPYHSVGVFLDKISKLPRIVSVVNLTMGTPTQAGKEMSLNSTFNLVTYRFLETPPADANAKGKKKK